MLLTLKVNHFSSFVFNMGIIIKIGFPGGSVVKNPPAVWETWVGKMPWRKAWQPAPIFLSGESPWTEEPGGLQSIGSQRIGHD